MGCIQCIFNLNPGGIGDTRMHFPTPPAGVGTCRCQLDEVLISVPFVQMWCGCDPLHSWNPVQGAVHILLLCLMCCKRFGDNPNPRVSSWWALLTELCETQLPPRLCLTIPVNAGISYSSVSVVLLVVAVEGHPQRFQLVLVTYVSTGNICEDSVARDCSINYSIAALQEG